MMEPTKSHIGFYTDLCVSLLTEDPLGAESSKNLLKDENVVRRRSLQEGLSFLTKTLPMLGKALDHGLESGLLNIPSSFRKAHGMRGIPAFMQGYFSRVFDSSGELLGTPDPQAVKHLRQVLFCFYKLETPYSKELENKVIRSFKSNELELSSLELGNAQSILDVASALAVEVLQDFDSNDVKPRHGPGAVSTGEKLDEKWTFSRLYTSIHRRYPFWHYYMLSGQENLDECVEQIRSLEVLSEGTAKVVLVPKDSRGPRLISAEPLEYQWIQQGIGRKLMSHLESHKLTKGFINFTLQSINSELALSSSADRVYATLDLKDASDRLSLDLVERLYQGNPEFLTAIKATRSTATRLPNGELISLRKCSPMGSAICFPLQALTFWLIVVAARQVTLGLPFNDAVRHVYVYGDDIIVPTNEAYAAVQALESCGLRVNTSKSCIKGFFRESCGTDAFHGVNVTPTRVKTLWTGQKRDGTAYVSYVSYLNSFRDKGYQGTSELIKEHVELLYGKLPYGTSESSFPCVQVDDSLLAEVLNLGLGFKNRHNAYLQREEFRVLTVFPKKVETQLDGLQRLLRDLTIGAGPNPSEVVIPRSARLKRGWVGVY